jgi:hypothetical protein
MTATVSSSGTCRYCKELVLKRMNGKAALHGAAFFVGIDQENDYPIDKGKEWHSNPPNPSW